MSQTLIREAYWQSMEAFIKAINNDVSFTHWHPVFGIL